MSLSKQQGDKLLCAEGARVLKLSKGRRRIFLKQLGPSMINRFGDASSGSHAMSLMDIITNKVGFAEYKYMPGWCHEPNPDAPMEVYLHGTAMRACDPLLPRLEKAELYGVFRRTHLVTGLQCQEQGDKMFPGTQRLLLPTMGNTEQQEALKYGVWMEVFSWEDFQANKDAFIGAMASDNHDSEIVMGEDELSVVCRFSSSLNSIKATAGQSHDDLVLAAVGKYCSGVMPQKDLLIFLDVAKTTAAETLNFLRPWRKFISDPQKFSVLPSTFKLVMEAPASAQWVRLTLFAWSYGADRENPKEVKALKGKLISIAVTSAHILQLRKLSKACLTTANGTIGRIVQRYWFEGMGSESARADLLLANVGNFLRKCGKLLTSSKAPAEEDKLVAMIAKFEETMRGSLDGSMSLPHRVCEAPLLDDQEQRRQDKAASAEPRSEKATLTFKEGGALVQNTAARASSSGFNVGARVVLNAKQNEVPEGSQADILAFCAKGVTVKLRVTPAVAPITVPLSSVQAWKADEKGKTLKRKAEEVALPDGIGFKLASSQQSSAVEVMWATCGLYKIHVGSGSGPNELRLVPEPRQVLAATDLKAEALCIAPFSTDVRASRPTGGEAYEEFILEIECHGKSQKRKLYSVSFEPHGENPAANPPVMQTLAPYWWLANVQVEESTVRLARKIVKVSVPLAATGSAPLKRAPGVAITLHLPFYTNRAEVQKGDALCGPASHVD